MAVRGLWQSIRSFVAERFAGSETHQAWSEPALTPEGKSLGFEWEVTSTEGREHMLLWPDASEAMEIGPLAGVDRWDPLKEWVINGDEQPTDMTRDEAMHIAEAGAAEFFIEPLVQASQKYHDDARGVELSDGFLQGMSEWTAQHKAQAECGPDMDSSLDR